MVLCLVPAVCLYCYALVVMPRQFSALFVLYLSIPLLPTFFFFLMIRRPPRSTLDRSSAASDVYKRQAQLGRLLDDVDCALPVGRADDVHRVILEERGQRKDISRIVIDNQDFACLLYTSPSPRDRTRSRMPSSA